MNQTWYGRLPLFPALAASSHEQLLSSTRRSQDVHRRYHGVQIPSEAKKEHDIQANVVILAGGFNEALVNSILKKLKEDTFGKDSSSSLLRTTVVRNEFASLPICVSHTVCRLVASNVLPAYHAASFSSPNTCAVRCDAHPGWTCDGR